MLLMLKNVMILLFLPLALTFGAVHKENLKSVMYPTAGVINPEQGTLEITITPSSDLKDLGQGWPFAVQILGKINSPQTRTIFYRSEIAGQGGRKRQSCGVLGTERNDLL